MTRGGLVAAGLAGAVSVALHAGMLIPFVPEAPRSLAGGAPQLAMVGNSFEDAVAGSVAGTADPVPTPPVGTSAARADTAAPAPATAATVPAPAPSPLPSSAARPAQIDRAAARPGISAARAVPATAADLPGAAPPAPSPPLTASVVRPTEAPAPSRPVAAAQAIMAVAADGAVTAQDGPVARVPDSDTPRPRPRAVRGEPGPAQQAEAPPRQPAPQGSAAETARAGDMEGTAAGSATRTQAGARGQAESDGTAAAEYPQRVNRHLVRLRRPATRFAGAAVVSFTIAESGGLAALSVAQSSGNAEFDRLALAHVQRAAPFPPPPTGAQRRFTVTIKGR